MIRRFYLMMISWAAMLPMMGQEENDGSLLNGLDYKVEFQSSVSEGNTPLWLNANKHGLSSLRSFNGYLRGAVERPLSNDSMRQWGVGYALDLVAPLHYSSDMIVQQAYAELRWKKGVLTLGSKEWPMELKDNLLSSGSQTLGINARPVPQLRVALPEYWALPLLGGWVHLKGHIAYGVATDGDWQQRFVGKEGRYVSHQLYHSKAGYLRIQKPQSPLSIELGLEMAAQFGGTGHNVITDKGERVDIQGGHRLKDYFYAFIPGGNAEGQNAFLNVEGNHLGSWVARIGYDADHFSLAVYADKFFEDHSGMFLLDYNGYESKNMERKQESFVLYKLKDIMLGLELQLKDCRWLSKVVGEYLYSKYQSGPVYHDHTEMVPDHVGGIDNYYNHYFYTGWQHWGQVIGNPLYMSPIYNDSHSVEVRNNRFCAFHLGFDGQPLPQLYYRMLLTYQEGLGTYAAPYTHVKDFVGSMVEVRYMLPKGWSVKGACGMDFGKLYGRNSGIQLSICKRGLLKGK